MAAVNAAVKALPDVANATAVAEPPSVSKVTVTRLLPQAAPSTKQYDALAIDD